jgi:branched-chain amino acid transport system substrate-binding protein
VTLPNASALFRKALALIVVLFAISTSATKADPEKTITVPIDLPFSGTAGGQMEIIARGAELAFDEAKLPGGFRVVTQRVDHGVRGVAYSLDAARATASAQVGDPHTLVAFGPYNSAVAQVTIPIFNAGGLALVAPGTTTPELTRGELGDSLRQAHPSQIAFFRCSATNESHGAAAAQFLLQLNKSRVAVVADDEIFGKSLADLFALAFKTAGGTVVMEEQVATNQYNFEPLMERLNAAKVDAVYVGALPSFLGLFRAQMGQHGLQNIALVTGPVIVGPEFANLAGPFVENSYFTFSGPDMNHVNGAANGFIKAYKARWHAMPTQFGYLSYAAAQVVINALARAIADANGALPTREAVRQAVAQSSKVPTVIGRVSFDRNGDIRDPLVSIFGYDDKGNIRFVNQVHIKSY